MKHIVWNIVPTALPEVVRHCSKCGDEGAFACSGKFRVNAQRRSLDIWLIYRCRACDTTWNARVYQHISPQSLSGDLLRRFTENDENLAREYALDCEFLRSNGAKVCPPPYDIEGDAFDPDEPIELGIRNECGLARIERRARKASYEPVGVQPARGCGAYRPGSGGRSEEVSARRRHYPAVCLRLRRLTYAYRLHKCSLKQAQFKAFICLTSAL